MANSIKNLLQRYTKGIRFVAVLTVLLTMGFGQAWGASYPLTVNYPYVYLDNSILGWDGCNVVVGHDSYSYGYLMTLIPNTKLFYKEIPANWGDAKGIVFVKGTSQWGEWNNKSLWDRTNTENRTGYQWDNQYESMDYHNTYLCTSTGSNDLIISYQSSGYSSLNSQQTIKSAVNGADANSKATISITSYKMTGNGQVTQQTATLGTGAKDSYVTAARTATTTLTVGDVETGYQFDGWYTAVSGGNAVSTSTTYTYTCIGEKTLYARFSAKTYTVTLNNQDATTAGQASVTATYNAAMPSIANNLPKKTGYTFNGYFDAASAGTKYYNADGTSARTWNKTANTTLYAQWTVNTYTVKWVVDGQEKATEFVAHGSQPTQAPAMDPNDPICGDKFVGWVTAPIEGQLEDASTLTIYEAANLPAITDETTFYAVFANYEE